MSDRGDNSCKQAPMLGDLTKFKIPHCFDVVMLCTVAILTFIFHQRSVETITII